MQCSNCGKQIPFEGNVCPYCHADKSGDQAVMVCAMIGAGIGGLIGYFINDVSGALVGGLIGLVPGVILGFISKGQIENQKSSALQAGQAQTGTASAEAVKKCPFCAETIKADAKKCRFCGELLNN